MDCWQLYMYFQRVISYNQLHSTLPATYGDWPFPLDIYFGFDDIRSIEFNPFSRRKSLRKSRSLSIEPPKWIQMGVHNIIGKWGTKRYIIIPLISICIGARQSSFSWLWMIVLSTNPSFPLSKWFPAERSQWIDFFFFFWCQIKTELPIKRRVLISWLFLAPMSFCFWPHTSDGEGAETSERKNRQNGRSCGYCWTAMARDPTRLPTHKRENRNKIEIRERGVCVCCRCDCIERRAAPATNGGGRWARKE